MSVKVSVGSSAFIFGEYESHPVPLNTLIERLEELNFQGIELVGTKPYADPDEVSSRSERKTLSKMFSEHGIEISNYGADFKERSPASSDPEERADYKKLFTKNLAFCVDCNIPSMRVDTVDEPPLRQGVMYDDAWKRFVDTWQEGAEQAQKEGVLIVWEFEPGFQFNRPSEIIRMVEDVCHPNFKLLFDSCHAHMCAAQGARQEAPIETLTDGEVEFAKRLKNRIGYVHLIDSDNTLHNNWTSTHAPFGTGVVDFDALTDTIIDAKYNGEWWTIDLCFWPKAWDILEESKLFMDSLLERHGLL